MNRLKELRRKKKLTQKALAEKLKIPYRTIQNWENEDIQIKPDKAKQLADYFGVPVGYLLGFNVDEVSESQIEFHNQIIDYIKKETYIRFIDFLVLTDLTLSDNQVSAIFNQLLHSSLINENYLRLEKDEKKIENTFSIRYKYTPDVDIRRLTREYYTNKKIDEKYIEVRKILTD